MVHSKVKQREQKLGKLEKKEGVLVTYILSEIDMEPFRRFCRLLLIIVFLILEDWMTSAELILHARLICLPHNFVLIHILCSSFVFLSPLRRKVPLII